MRWSPTSVTDCLSLWARLDLFCWLAARMWLGCCWHGPPHGSGRWPCARRWARAEVASRAKCLQRACSFQALAEFWACSSLDGGGMRWFRLCPELWRLDRKSTRLNSSHPSTSYAVFCLKKKNLLGPTVPQFWAYNPAYAQVQNEHTWMTGWMDIIQGGMAPQAAAEKAFKRVAEIFARYPITQG